MGSGNYYRAKQRTGGFSGALQPLVNFFKEKKRKEEEDQWLQGIMGLLEDQNNQPSGGGVQPKSPDDNNLGVPKVEGGGQGYFDEENDVNNLTPKGKSFYPDEDSDVTANDVSYETEFNGMATKLKERVPQSQDNSYGSTLERPNTQQLGGTNNNLQPGGGADQYGQSQDRIKEFMMAIANAPPGTNTDVFRDLLGFLQQQSEGYKPKDIKRTAVSPYSDVYDEYGDKIKSGDKKSVNNLGKVDKMTSTRVNAKGEKIQTWQNQTTGKTYEKNVGKVRDTRSGTKDDDKDKEKSLDDAFAKDIASLKNLDVYSYTKDGNKIPIYGKDDEGKYTIDTGEYEKQSASDIRYKKDRILERIKLKLLSKRTYEFVNNIESKWREGDKTGSKQYLKPIELKKEAEKHYLAGNIDEEQLKEIKTYLKYYSVDIYKGLATN